MANIILDPSNLNVTGTSDDDIFIATPSSQGDFTIAGGAGFDTLDYSQLGQGITINVDGTISKGSLGTDTSKNNDRFIGAIGQNNSFDGTANGGIPDPNSIFKPNFNIDLSKNIFQFDVAGVTRFFEAFNFNRIIGSNYNDKIVGDDTGNILTGGSGDDIVTGGNGNDIITGCNSAARGVGEVDILTGGGGADTFVLGDRNGSFYVGNGKNDYASIRDFDLTQDRLQLGANKESLTVRFDKNERGTIDLFSNQSGCKDLIAKITLSQPLYLGCRGDRLEGQYVAGIGNEISFNNDVFQGKSSLDAIFDNIF